MRGDKHRGLSNLQATSEKPTDGISPACLNEHGLMAVHDWYQKGDQGHHGLGLSHQNIPMGQNGPRPKGTPKGQGWGT